MGKLITITEAARRFGLTEQTMRNWIKEGYIFTKQVGRARYIDEDAINALQNTAEDILRQQKKLESLRAEISATYKATRDDYEESRLQKRYMNFMVGAAFRSGFFATMVHLLEKCGDLKSREAEILIEFLNGTTLEEISKMYGLTRERIRQIVEKAIRKSRTLTNLEQRIDEVEALKSDNEALKVTIAALRKKLREQEEMDYIESLKDEEERKKALMANDEVCRLLTTKLIDMNLSVRALNYLKSDDIETVGDLCQKQKIDILKIRNLGKKTLTELNDLLESLGLSWGTDVEAILKQRVAVLMKENSNV